MTGRAPLPVGAARDSRRRYVAELRRRIRAGTYRVDAIAVADAILRDAQRRS